MDERTLGVPTHLVDVEEHGERVVAVVGRPGAPVHVDGHVEIRDDLPQPVVRRVVERLDPFDVGRHVGDEDATAEAVVLDPADVLNGVIDVVEEDLTDPGPALGELVAEVHQPAVVRPDPGQPVLVVLGLGRWGEEHEPGEERGHRVREDDLADHAVLFLLAVAHLVVPVAKAPGVAEVLEGVLVLGPPGVKVLEILGIEILPVGGMAAPGVAVGGDDRVVALGPIEGGVAGFHSCPRFTVTEQTSLEPYSRF